MTYQTTSTTWVESFTAAATLALGVLIGGDAYLQHQTRVEQAMPLVRLEPVTISAQRGLVQLEPVIITAARTVRSVHTAQTTEAVAAPLQSL